jgi:ABC-2 type transport system permease protein
MTALAAERIKLFSTRSPWWCSALAVGLVVGTAALALLTSDADAGTMPAGLTAFLLQLGMVIVMVMAAVSVTTEYRFATIRTTFQAVPNRAVALLAKTAVVTALAAVVGLLAGLGAWAAAWVLRPAQAVALADDAAWRIVAGPGLVFAVAAVLAVAVGILLRQTAGAVSLLLVWSLLAENLVAIVPGVGDDVVGWLPFVNATHFLGGGPRASLFSPWGALAYVAVLAAGVLAVALTVADRRDA